MAQQNTVVMRDDLTGGKAAETVSFALDGTMYEIDLNKRNAAALRKVLGAYIAAGRPAAKPTRRRRPASRTSARTGRAANAARAANATAPSQAEIRAWATEQGIEVAARGRISNAVREQYLAGRKR